MFIVSSAMLLCAKSYVNDEKCEQLCQKGFSYTMLFFLLKLGRHAHLVFNLSLD